MFVNMQKRKFKKGLAGVLVLFLVLTALVATGCETVTEDPQTPTTMSRKTFTARRESEDGAIVAWSGYSDGYEPGAEESFEITITNETDQTLHGRFCLQLMDRELPMVVATLEQREFTLEPGVGFSDTIIVQFPEALSEGAYSLSLPVRRAAGSMVDLVTILVGDTDEVRRASTQQDMDASLEACPPVERANGEAEQLVELARADLAQRLGIALSEIAVRDVQPTEFPDASLGVPEPGVNYAQVVTPGYIIKIAVNDESYMYHGADDRVVLVPDEKGTPGASITIERVQVAAGDRILVQGRSTLPDGTCLGSELWEDGEMQEWWPGETCVQVQDGSWQCSVPMGKGGVPAELDASAQYVLRVYEQNGSDVVSVFPFDLAGPPTSNP